MKNINHFSVALYSLFAAGLLSGCGSTEAAADKKNDVPKTNAGIETFVLKKDKFSTTLQLPGELLAFRQVDLYAKVTSFVKELRVDIGSEVTEGQLLMTLEAPELSSQLSAAESRLRSQEAVAAASMANYNRLIEAGKTPGTVSQNDLDNATAKKNSDAATLEAARAAYREIGAIKDYLEIRAPFSGVITARNVNPGAYVGPAGKGSELPLLILQEQKQLRLAVSIPEAYTGYLHTGDTIGFRVRSFPGKQFRANVARMAGALDVKLRSERVEMDVANPGKTLLPGMVADVTISLSASDSTLVVPKTALVNSTEGLYVITVVNQHAKRVPVKKGRDINDRLEVFGGLQAGETLVSKASEELHDGMIVK